ncbi:HAD-IA family hydrolase [Nordella sp. HKS 07]|uniref:HAD-IA family hydrolase n=1 Tax=Nordella sp. HKS 07 TaxID=2712222 RepID=UPI0013E200E5|nr:HAD-IA family hydrolase [Nordella sp. HKS 07]QIG51158.1 HAD-IA family hydrolase [Nordella sp. HKS 07]
MKLALFDVDGTLMDSQAMILASLTAAFNSEGLPLPSRNEMLGIVGLSLVKAMATLRPHDEAARHERLAESYKQAFWSYRTDKSFPEIPFDGALDLLRRLQARDDVLIGIATGKSQRGVRHIIDQFGLEGVFTTIQTSDDAPSKPHPGMILQAMTETGARAEDTVMIGDAIFDIDMAHAAGVKAVAVGWGFQPANVLAGAKPHAIVNDFNHLEETLGVLWQDKAA